MNLEQRIQKYIDDMRRIDSAVVPAVIANDLQEIFDASASASATAATLASDLHTAIGDDLDRLIGSIMRGAKTDHAFRTWAQGDMHAVAWEFRDNSWQAGMWASITKRQYEGYLGPDVTGPRDSWQVRALFDHPAKPGSFDGDHWVLVPRFATSAMMDSFSGTDYAKLPLVKQMAERKAYTAMLAAAPVQGATP